MQKIAMLTWSTRAFTFALAAGVALSASYWFLKSTQDHSVSTAAPVAPPAAAPLDPLAVARALGGGAVAVESASGPTVAARPTLVLLGVLADNSRGGAALISVDGKPAKPFVVGASVDGQLMLKSVSARRATLSSSSDGPAVVTLDLPALSK